MYLRIAEVVSPQKNLVLISHIHKSQKLGPKIQIVTFAEGIFLKFSHLQICNLRNLFADRLPYLLFV
jgi:hypothetical protein